MEDLTLHDLVKLCCLCFIPVSDSLRFTMFHYGNWRFVNSHRCPLQVESPLQRTFLGSFFRKTMWLGSDIGTTVLRYFLNEQLLIQTSDSNLGSWFSLWNLFFYAWMFPVSNMGWSVSLNPSMVLQSTLTLDDGVIHVVHPDELTHVDGVIFDRSSWS